MITKLKNKIVKKTKLPSRNFVFKVSKNVFAGLVVVLVIVGQLLTPQVANAAVYNFTQSSWAGGATANVANHTSNQSSWTQYSSKSGTDASTAVTITPTAGSVIKTSEADFGGGANSQTVVSSAGSVELNSTSINVATPMIVAGYRRAMALKYDGTVWGWGNNVNGQLGNNSQTNSATPVQVVGPGGVGYLNDAIYISTSSANSCAIRSDTTVWCWGTYIGDNTGNLSLVPVQVHGVNNIGYLTGITKIVGSSNNTLALKSDGTVYFWGYNSNGNAGDGTLTSGTRFTPVQVHGENDSGYLTNIIDIGMFANGTGAALKSDGTILAWGFTGNGELGNNTTTPHVPYPMKVHGVNNSGYLTGITSMAIGGFSGFGLKSDGTVWGWGGNGGKLGDATTTNRLTPVQMHGINNSGFMTTATKIASGSYNVFGLTSGNQAFGLGANGSYPGTGSTSQCLYPCEIKGVDNIGYLTDTIQLAGGLEYAGYALQNNGDVLAWGLQLDGQLGNNITSTNGKTYPINVHGPNNVGYLNLAATATYYSSGTYTSAVVDLTAQKTLSTLSYTTTLNGQTITVDARAGDVATPDGTWTAWQTGIASGGSIAGLGSKRYVQYRVNLSTADTAVTPTFDSITINYTSYVSGNLTSSVYDSQDATNLFSSVAWTATNTSGTETVKVQVRSSADNSTWSAWCGYIDCTGSTYFNEAENGVALQAGHPLLSDGNDRYLQYKVFLASAGAITPSLSSVVLEYVVNATPTFNPDYPTTSAGGATASQVSDSQSADYAKVAISYSVKDTDTATGANTPNQILPSFEYSIDGGSNWSAIPSNNMTAGDTSLKTVLGGSYTVYSAVWDAPTTVPNTSVNNAKIRVTVNDGEAANNLATASTANFNLDTQAPVVGTAPTFDAGLAGVTNSATITIPLPTDLSGVYYMISDDSLTQTNPTNTGWVSINSGTTIPWTFDSDIEAKSIKYKYKDAFGNTTAETTVSTQAPVAASSFLVQDASNISIPSYDIYVGWEAANASGFSSYKLEFATSADNVTYGSYSAIVSGDLSTASTNYYVHRNLNTSLFYRYRLAILGSNGNTSVRSSSFTTAKPDGVQNYGEGGGGSIAIASKVENVVPVQGSDKDVTISYLLTDSNALKISPSYEAYMFYNIGIILPANALSGDNLTVSDASKLKSSGYIQINNEVIKYTTKTGNVLSGLTRGTWPTDVSSGRTTRTNTTLFAGAPVWVMASGTSPIGITDSTISSGQSGSITWDTSTETALTGDTYTNVGIKVLVHDNQDASSGPLSSQNDYSEIGILDLLDLSVSAVGSSSIKATSAVITWSSVDYADSLVEYGTVAPGGEGAYNLSKSSSEKVLQHSIYLSGLTPSTTYYYKTTSTDLDDNATVSEASFTTTAGPVISGATTSNLTDTGITITWTTNIQADSYVNYSLNSSLSGSTRVGSLDLATSHSVSLSGLASSTTYYYSIDSTDASENIGEDANGGTYYSFTTTADATAPIISAISAPIITANEVAIVWTTNEPANGKISYGLNSGAYTNETTLVPNLISNHLATISSLAETTPYYYVVVSADANGNTATSTEQTFTTPATERIIVSSGGGGVTGVAQAIYDALLKENEANKAKIKDADTEAPVISDVLVYDITAFGATVSFKTDEDALSFIEYGKKQGEYDQLAADNKWSKDHLIRINGLNLGTNFYFKVKAMDRANNISFSEEKKFTTKFLSEDLSELKKIENVEQFQKEIEATIESILPSLVPPFIDTPVISDITENSAVITFKTNVKAYPVINFSADEDYDNSKDNPYNGEISDTSEKSFTHTMQLVGLKSNTKYHFSARAFSIPQVVGKSDDITFTTAASKIRGSVIDIKKDSFTVLWNTDEPTTSVVEYKNISTGRISRIVDDVKNNSHSVKIENLSPGTLYQVNISGINNKGNVVEGSSFLDVRTSIDNNAPEISNLKINSTLVPGRNDKVQSIVSWQTDEPSTSVVYFEEGSGSLDKELSNKQEDLELTMNHVVILSNLKPGTVYRFTIASTDDVNNTTKPPIRTIITPQKSESIVDVIFKNFDDTFNFIKNVR